jgi:hypothetical protein
MSELFEPSDSHGLEQRDYRNEPIGSVFAGGVMAGKPIPRERWPDLIRSQKSRGNSPLVAHQYHQVPVLDQGTLKYCWAYSVVAGVMNRLAFQGIDPVPHLSATAVAAVGLDFANRGGHCSKAVKMMQDQGGIPSIETWPNRSLDRTLKSDPKVLESREKNQLCSFTDCGNNLDLAISLMIAETPSPVTFSVPWWRHAILGLEVLDRGGAPATSLDRYGIAFVNSYGPRWNGNGFGEFWGEKLHAWEYVGIHQALPRAET